jgi:hypothetical protein
MRYISDANIRLKFFLFKIGGKFDWDYFILVFIFENKLDK